MMMVYFMRVRILIYVDIAVKEKDVATDIMDVSRS